ncbi:aldehyde dehydrogenase family protein [Spirillospora sp. CA-255316]
MITTGHYVAGRLVTGDADEITEVHDPSTGEVIGRVPAATAGLVGEAVTAATEAADAWAATPLAERAAYLDTWREKLVAESEALLDLTVDELGLIPAFATNIHIGRATKYTVGLAEMAERVLAPRREAHSLVVREPAGVVAAITAWNFPLHMLVAKAAGALITGNTVVVKPSEVKALAAWRATELLAELGLPPGVVNVVGGTGPGAGAALVSDPRIDLISFTGSRAVGSAIMTATAPLITRSVLELGGKSAGIVLPDASLDDALAGVVGSCFFNNGQVCGAQTRLLVHRDQLAEVEERVAAIVDATVVGPARDPRTTLGPVVSAVQLERVGGYITHGMESGLRLVAGGAGRPGGVPDGGYYVRPTVFSDVPRDHRLAQEEIFGPVLVIQTYTDEDELVAVANSTRYGLAGSVWSGDLDRAVAVARRIRTGQLQVNGGAFNLHAPYGGVRGSGNGREHGLEGLAEFTEVKSLQLPQ